MSKAQKRLPAGMHDPAKRTISNPQLKDTLYFVKYSAETNGEYVEVDMTVGPGGQTPIHYHTQYAEIFTARSSGLGLLLDGKNIKLQDGETVAVQPGHVHKWYNDSDSDIKFRIRIEPGYDGFEKGMHIFHGLATDGLTGPDGAPKGPINLSVFVCNLDVWISGLLRWLGSPILVGIYKYAQWSGQEEKLLEKYYY